MESGVTDYLRMLLEAENDDPDIDPLTHEWPAPETRNSYESVETCDRALAKVRELC